MWTREITGKNIDLRDVEIDDAAFILALRTDTKKSKHLHQTANDLEQQENYLQQYKQGNNTWYFIIESKNAERLGTIRIYDIKGDSFCWGSWLIIDNAPKTTAIESALLVYEYAFYQLGFKRAHFDVRKENARVVDFHQRFGAKIVDEDELDYFFEYDLSAYEQVKKRYQRFLANA